MGKGFPNIPSRTAFGPTFENKHPVVSPTRQLDAATMNLVAWQTCLAVAMLTGFRSIEKTDPW